MESYIVQFDFSAAFDRVSHSGLLFKLKSIGLGGCMLSTCMEFLSNRRQRVMMVDSATSAWIPIVSGEPQGSVLGHFLFILYASEMLGPDRKQTICPCWWRHITGSCLQASRHLLLLPPLTGTWLRFRSCASITDCREWRTWLDSTKWLDRTFFSCPLHFFPQSFSSSYIPSVSLSCFNLAVPMRKCLGKLSCMSSPFSI